MPSEPANLAPESMQIKRYDLWSLWFIALVLLGAVVWQPLLQTELPFLYGLRKFAGLKEAWFLVGTFLAVVVWLSVPRWHTKERFLMLSGAAFAMVVWLGLTLSVSMALLWACVGGAVGRALGDGLWRVAVDDPMAQKLTLARAYIDMGNRVEADALLREVIRDGTPAQKLQAAMLTKPQLS